MKKFRIPYLCAAVALLACLIGGLIYFYIELAYRQDIVPVADLPQADAIIIFGAMVYSDDRVSYVLAKRLDAGIEAYQQGKADKIIVSGDHGTLQYNEVVAMKNYLLSQGVPREDIFMDHAGFSTYDTIYRAKEIFEIDKAILVSQETHLLRALFIADCLGFEAKGTKALSYEREIAFQKFREVGARVKAFAQAGVLKPEPQLLGDKIPVFSNSGIVTE